MKVGPEDIESDMCQRANEDQVQKDQVSIYVGVVLE